MIKIDIGIIEAIATEEQIAIYWNVAHEEHRRSWLCAAVGSNANMEMTVLSFAQLPALLRRMLVDTYKEGRDLDFIQGA